MKLLFSNLVFILLGILSPKITTFRFFNVKLLCESPVPRLASLREVGIVAATFLVEYVVAVLVG